VLFVSLVEGYALLEDERGDEIISELKMRDRLCGLVVRIPGHNRRGLGFDSQRYQISE
jgi:hypothetical protein